MPIVPSAQQIIGACSGRLQHLLKSHYPWFTVPGNSFKEIQAMQSKFVIVLVLASVTLIGCQAQTAQDEVVVTQDAATVRAAIQTAQPDALVGVVSEVLTDERFAAVRDIPVDQFGMGQILSVINTDQQLVTHGQVVRIVGDALHIQYDAPPAGGRAPQVGDLAVRFQ
jgi:hypothetical protein